MYISLHTVTVSFLSYSVYMMVGAVHNEHTYIDTHVKNPSTSNPCRHTYSGVILYVFALLFLLCTTCVVASYTAVDLCANPYGVYICGVSFFPFQIQQSSTFLTNRCS